jgi:uncharacterized protein MJ0014
LIKISELTKEQYTAGEVAKLLGVHVKTVQVWDRTGVLPFSRTHTNRRILPKDKIIELLDSRGLLYKDENANKRDVIYARVSSHEEMDKGDLDRQVMFLVNSISDLKNPLILSEVGSGLNDRREKLLQLIEMIFKKEVDRVFVIHKDRLTRFGFHYLEAICKSQGVSIVVIKDISKEKSIEEELTEDMMALVASFSGKLYRVENQEVRALKKIEADNQDFKVEDIIEK